MDFDSSLPVRTENDGDIVAAIVDKNTPANSWDINAAGAGLIRGDASDPIPVVVVDADSGDEVHIFGTEVAGVPSTENTVVDYTVTAGKVLLLKAIQASASGKFKVELKVGPAASEVSRAVAFGSTSHGSVELVFPKGIEVAAGDKVLLLITNRDKANADVYGFINGVEV